MTTAGLLESKLPLADLRPQTQPWKSDRPAFAQHLQEAEADIPVVRQAPRTPTKTRTADRPAGAKTPRRREPNTTQATAPVAVPAETDEPRPLEFNLNQSNGEGTEHQGGGLSGAALLPAATELQAGEEQASVELSSDLAFAAKVASDAPAAAEPKGTTGQSAPASNPMDPLADLVSAVSSKEQEKSDAGHEASETTPAAASGPSPAPAHNAYDPTAKPVADAASPAPRVEDAGSTQPTQVVQINPVDHQPQKATHSLRDVQVQLGGGPQERVEVRLMDKSGELHVAVRAASETLTRDLREGLSDLVGKLESGGYRTETWRPGTVSAAPAAAETNLSNDRHDRDAQGQARENEQSNHREQQNQQKPRWVEELEDNALGGSPRLSGGYHGFIR